MSKYTPLWEHIQKDGRPSFKLTFAEIQEIAGIPIDHSFLNFKRELADYGYSIGKISMKEKHVTFNKEGVCIVSFCGRLAIKQGLLLLF